MPPSTPPSTTTSAGFANPADTWNRRFSQDGFVFGTAPNAWLRDNAAVWPKGAHILSVADGEGRNSVWLASQGHVVDAFDIAEVGVAKARKLAGEQGVSVNFSVADCDSFAWPAQTYDGIAAIFVQFADPALRARMFANMVRSLKPGGVLILQGYTPRQLDYKTGGPSVLSHLYTEELLREAFAALEIETLRAYDADVQEGAGHSGMSALIGLVARKPGGAEKPV
jgi:2-polyprenyl-3-methyl-5-hydroxy-6-metoxy-1,4-benzoquinol methylase